MKRDHIEKQRLLRTEQKPDYVKDIALYKDSLIKTILSGDKDAVIEIQQKILSMQAGETVSGDIGIAKLYLAAFFSELIEDTKNAGLPASQAYSIKDQAFQHLSAASNQEEIHGITMELYGALFDRYQKYSLKRYSTTVALAIERIHDLRMQEITPSKIAALIHVDRTYLSKRFHEETGITLKDYIQKVKIELAIKLIEERNYNLLEISDLLGFSSYAVFSKSFLRVQGVLPGKYRNLS